MALSEFIEKNMERLVSRWEAFAQAQVPAAAAMSSEQIRDGARAILRAAADDMRTSQSDFHRKQKSQGLRPAHAPRITEMAQEHASDRLDAGFTLDQLVSEYRALRASVIRQWTKQIGEQCGPRELNELIRFDEAMDQSLTEAVRWFNGGVERSRDIFVGVLGHDLRDPLNAIYAATDLQLVAKDDDTLRAATERIRASVGQMAELVQNLLDFARTRLGGRIPLSRTFTDLAALCRDTADAVQLSHPGREVRLECRGDLSGLWDAERVRELLTNLIANALEHGSPETPVTVIVQGEADEICLRVHNDGPPIATDRRQSIFEPLVRGDDASEPRSADGLGLGLYIVKQIARAHGGTVELRSTADEGTTFTVRLPRHS